MSFGYISLYKKWSFPLRISSFFVQHIRRNNESMAVTAINKTNLTLKLIHRKNRFLQQNLGVTQNECINFCLKIDQFE